MCGGPVENGYTHVCCTPTSGQFAGKHGAEHSARTMAAYQEGTLRKAGIPLALIPGGEINLEWNWPAVRGWKDEVPLAGWREVRAFRFLEAEVMPDFLGPATKHLQELGHADRGAPEREAAIPEGTRKKALIVFSRI